MSKRIYYIFAILSILSLTIILETYTVVCLNATINDPENDVYYIHVTLEGQEMKKGDYHDEIDIIRLNITGQNFNLTFADDISDWNMNHSATILLYPYLTEEYPYYTISYENHSANGGYLGFHVFFINVTGWEDLYWSEESGWVSDPSLATDIGYVSDKSIIANVPTNAYMIPDDIICVAISQCYFILMVIQEGFQYLDFAPNEYDPFGGDDEGIPSYDIFIVLGLLFGISLIIVKKHIKKK